MLLFLFFFLMIRRPPRSTQSRSSAASDVYKRQGDGGDLVEIAGVKLDDFVADDAGDEAVDEAGCPLREGLKFARAFFVVVAVQTMERVVELAADFAAVVKVGEHLRKLRAMAHD